MINIRKLAAVDMVFLGRRVILAEYAIGVLLPLVLGLFSLRAGLRGAAPVTWEAILGLWLIGIAANYLPLFIYSVILARGGTVEAEGRPEMARARRYGIQQVILLVPFLVAIVALVQEGRRQP